MNTNKDSAASDVPTFKVARVGQERKRKGGAFSFLRGGSGPRGVWQGATGGSGAGGAAGAAGMTFSKIMTVLMVTSVVGSAAIYTGSRSAAKTRMSGTPAKPALFAQDKIKIEGDTSNLPTNPNTIPNSMGFITGSRDGLTPEERAKKEADAAAAAEAQRIADEEAAKKEAANTAANPAVDPNALLASAQADGGPGKGGGFGKKFGALSSSMGGGSSLSGGAGMSGGVNRQFGSSGSIAKGKSGSISAMKGASRATYSKSGHSKLAASRTKGFARKQLANANAYSRRGATAGKGESSASDAGAAFDNNPGAGNTIEGPGIAKGAGPASGTDGSVNPNNGGPTGGGGGPAQVDCGPDRYQNADGGCSDLQVDGGKDANPMLSMMSNVAMMLLMVIGVLSMISTAAKATGYGTVITPALMGAICALGAIVTLLGVAMMAMGDYVTGGVATLVGGIVTYMAYGSEASLTIGQGMVAGFGGAALSMVGKMLGGSSDKNKAPVAAQQ